jgi:hypothetical protein
MTEASNLQLLDHELADDELKWVSDIYQDFAKVRTGFAGRENEFNPKETLRAILGKKEHLLPTPMDLSGDGPWRNGGNRHGRLAACVFLKKVELHKHAKSRTDHFHNSPDAPHAFLPKVGEQIGNDWEIAFIAITPRNLREDTQSVSEQTRAAYKRVVGREAPVGV